MKSQVFLSYSRKDEKFAHDLARQLKQRNVPVWVDKWDIPHGADWPREVQNAIRSCTHVLLVLSPNSVASKEVRVEMYYASDSGKVILPVICAACEIPLRIRPLQYVDFTSQIYSTALDQVVKLFETQTAIPVDHEPSFVMHKPGSPPTFHDNTPRRLVLNGRDRWVAGVLAGLAEYWGVNTIFLRVAFIILTLLTQGLTLFVYPILWWWMVRRS